MCVYFIGSHCKNCTWLHLILFFGPNMNPGRWGKSIRHRASFQHRTTDILKNVWEELDEVHSWCCVCWSHWLMTPINTTNPLWTLMWLLFARRSGTLGRTATSYTKQNLLLKNKFKLRPSGQVSHSFVAFWITLAVFEIGMYRRKYKRAVLCLLQAGKRPYKWTRIIVARLYLYHLYRSMDGFANVHKKFLLYRVCRVGVPVQ